MFELIGIFTVFAVLVPILLVCAFVCFTGTLLESVGWLALGAFKLAIGLVFVIGMVLLSLLVLPFGLLLG